MRISDWSSDVCSSDLAGAERLREQRRRAATVVAERQCLRAAPPGQTAEGAPEGIGVPLRDRRPDGAAQVVLAQYRGIEAVWRQRIVRQRHLHRLGVRRRLRTADGAVTEAGGPYVGRIVDVAQVDRTE